MGIAGTIVRTKIVHEEHILLVKTRRTVIYGAWEFPGGAVKDGELIEVAAIRELEEETGVTGIPLTLSVDYSREAPSGSFWRYVYYTGVAIDEVKIKPLDCSEILAARWFSSKQLPKLSEELTHANEQSKGLILKLISL